MQNIKKQQIKDNIRKLSLYYLLLYADVFSAENKRKHILYPIQFYFYVS